MVGFLPPFYSGQPVSAIYLPKILRVGAGSSRELPQLLAELGLASPLLVTDPFIVKCGYLDRVTEPLALASINFGIFAESVPDPTTDSVSAGVNHWRRGRYDCVVAIGGGGVAGELVAFRLPRP